MGQCTHGPQMNEPRFKPHFMVIHMDTSLFSMPRSPRTRDGVPYCSIAVVKTSSTVDARLLVLARKPVICCDYQIP